MRDEEGFERFVAARWSTYFRLALLLTASEPAAQDLLQTTLEKAYGAWPRISRIDAPDAYVRTIMVNTLISSRRLAWRRHEVTTDEPPERSDPLDGSAERRVLDHELLWPLVCALPQRQRAVIVLRYYEDLSEAEIAEALGCAVGTVKSTASDAMRALRRGFDAITVQGSLGGVEA